MDNLAYVVMIEDRHTDVEVELFISKEKAIKRAKTIFNEYKYEDDEDEDMGETELDFEAIEDGWIYSAIYSSEGDKVSVRECKLNEEVLDG